MSILYSHYLKYQLHILGGIVLAAGVLLSSALPAQAAVCSIATDTTIDQSYIDTNSCDGITITASAVLTFTEAINLQGSNQFLINSGVTATFDGDFELSDPTDSLQIEGTLVAPTSVSNQVQEELDLTADTITITATGAIDLDGIGCPGAVGTFAKGVGPRVSDSLCSPLVDGTGGGSGSVTAGAGAGHGGAGGIGRSAAAGLEYDSETNPIYAGAGGGAGGAEDGGDGGGLLFINATTVDVDGIITVDGTDGAASVNSGGGGSGGTINIITTVIDGTGSISAIGGDGGDGSSRDGGGGAGGRIAIDFVTDNSTWISTLDEATETAGGTTLGVGGSTNGSDGTIYLNAPIVPNTPSITTPVDNAIFQNLNNLELTSSEYSGVAVHTLSDWQISDDGTFSDADCSDTNIVWCSMDTLNLTSNTVNDTNGTFQNALSGQTTLAGSSTYYVRVRHANGTGDSNWSTVFSFETENDGVVDWSQCRTEVGTTQIPASQNSVDHTLTTTITDTSKAFVLHRATGPSTLGGANDHLVTGYIHDTNTLRFERVASPSAAAEISYSVVECFNDEFTVQTGEIVLGTGEKSDTATITGVNTVRSFPIVSVRSTDTASDERESLVWANLTNYTTVHVERWSGYNPQVTVRYQVVFFNGSTEIEVHPLQVTLPNSAASATGTVPSSPLDRSWVYCSYNGNSNGLRQTSIGCELTDATTVTAHRHGAGSYINTVQFHVIEFPESSGVTTQSGNVQDHDPFCTADTQCDHDITITSPIASLTGAFPYMTNTTSATGVAYPRNHWISSWLDASTIRNSVWNTVTENFDEADMYWQVVEFPTSSVPDDPTLTAAEAEDQNPDISSSAYSGGGSHASTDWKIVETADCSAGASVWEATDDVTNLVATVANTTNGSFVGTLAGQTELAAGTIYYACVRHENAAGDSGWSAPVSFSTNKLPDVTAAELESGSSSFSLTPQVNTTITATATVEDNDSCQDLDTVDATFFRTGQGQAGADNNNYRYTMVCTQDVGTCTGPSDTEADYTCTADITYYAEGTDAVSQNAADDWTVEITADDGTDTGDSSTDTIEVETLVAFEVSATVNFGSLSPGTNTGTTNQLMTITNYGNAQLDMDVSDYGLVASDGLAMSCATGSIPDSNLKYDTSAFTYSSGGIAASSTPIEFDLDLAKSTGSVSSTTLYTGIAVPSATKGACTGFLELNAINDQALD